MKIGRDSQWNIPAEDEERSWKTGEILLHIFPISKILLLSTIACYSFFYQSVFSVYI